MSNANKALGSTPQPTPQPTPQTDPTVAKRDKYSPEEVFGRFKNYIEGQKPGLKRFYKVDGSEPTLKDASTRGSTMTEGLIKNGCPDEVAAALSVLVLYDLVVLIDNSISMGMEENGARVKTLRDTMKVVSKVYTLGETDGLTAVRLLNTSKPYFKVKPGNVGPLMKKIVFEGLTDIGTKLRDKVLAEHVTPEMKKPLLVVVLTDAEIEGETKGLLKDVIVSQAVELQQQETDAALKPFAPQAVAYQFAKIGNEKTWQDLVTHLDDPKLRSNVNCMGDGSKLEDLLKDIWWILPKLLLGAFSEYWGEGTKTPDAVLKVLDDELPPPAVDEDELGEEEDEDDETILSGNA